MRSKNGAMVGASDPKQPGTDPAFSNIRANRWHNLCRVQGPGHVGGTILAGLHVALQESCHLHVGGVRIGGAH